MKIAYILSHDIDRNDGVVKKIIDQVEHWKKLGHDVNVFTVCNDGSKSKLKSKNYKFEGAIKSRLLLIKALYNDVIEFKPDVIYFRYDFWNKTVFELSKNIPLIVESNTASFKEAGLQIKTDKSLKSILRYISLSFFTTNSNPGLKASSQLPKKYTNLNTLIHRLVMKLCQIRLIWINTIR
ncbi:hypothetical protein [Pseudoalteromonas xiamenensis]